MLSWLSQLPNCPCQYPMNILYNDSIYDPLQQKSFSWKRVTPLLEKLYKPSTVHCIRQQITNASTSLTVQVCCFDNSNRELITRGTGAGTPYLVTPEYNYDKLHEQLDLVPLLICGGDWTRYQALRPPNNGLNCTQYPGDQEYERQVELAKNF